MPDLNAASLEAAMSMIAGTARSMGVTVEEQNLQKQQIHWKNARTAFF